MTTAHGDDRRGRVVNQRMVWALVLLTIAAACTFTFFGVRQLEAINIYLMKDPDIDLQALTQGDLSTAPYGFEAFVLGGRHHFMRSAVLTRTWLKFLGFLSGMLLTFLGAAYVLGKLRIEAATASFDGGGVKATLSTTSPGVFLAAAGAAIVIVSIYINPSVSFTDQAVFIPPVLNSVQTLSPSNTSVSDLATRSYPQDCPSLTTLQRISELEQQQSLTESEQAELDRYRVHCIEKGSE